MPILSRTACLPSRQALDVWFSSPRGRRLLAVEQQVIGDILPGLFGRNLLQVGTWGVGEQLVQNNKFAHSAVFGCAQGFGEDAVWGVDGLPLVSDIADAIILPHILEFVGDPHGLLRDVDRILTDRGHLIILGFNPLSVWGLGHASGLGYPARLGNSRYYRRDRICDWLSVLGFETRRLHRYNFHSALDEQSPDWLSAPFAPFADGYAIVARKRRYPMTPIRPAWRRAVGAVSVTGMSEARLGHRRG